VALAAAAAFLVPAAAHAVQDDPNAAITYDPAFVFLEAPAGEQVEALVTIKNQTRVAASFELALLDMRAGPAGDDAFEYVEPGRAARGAAPWMRLGERTFELAAGTERLVRVAIAIPPDAGAGGHYAAISSTVRPVERAGGQFDVDLTTPIPIFVTVSGELQRDLRVRLVPGERLRWGGGAATWNVQLHNAGDVHEVVGGRVQVQSTFSGSTSTAIRAAILLPDERRVRPARFVLRSAPDTWRARVRIERDGGEPLVADAGRVWVLPWWLLLVVFIGALITSWRLRSRRIDHAHEHQFADDAGDDPFD
jgi:hypothetical protein